MKNEIKSREAKIGDVVRTVSKGTLLEGLEDIDKIGTIKYIIRNHLEEPSYLVHGYWWDDQHIVKINI